jgi:hypothetical protein
MTLQILSAGGKDDLKSFADVLARCAGKGISIKDGIVSRTGTDKADPDTQPLLDALDKMIKDPNTITIKVRDKARKGDPTVDGFCQRLVVVEHLEAFPEDPPTDHPSATTRCEALIHILVEYLAAAQDGHPHCDENFMAYHKKAVEAQTALRKARKQCAAKQNVEVEGRLEMQHCNKTVTYVTQDPDTGRIKVDHGPKEDKTGKKDLKFEIPRLPGTQRDDSIRSLFSTSPLIFTGEIEEIDEPPAHWSNFFLAYQRVRYGALEFIKGEVPGVYLDVFHLLVENTASAHHGQPGLDRRQFGPGKRQVVFAEPAIDPLATSSFRLVSNYPRQVLSLHAGGVAEFAVKRSERG